MGVNVNGVGVNGVGVKVNGVAVIVAVYVMVAVTVGVNVCPVNEYVGVTEGVDVNGVGVNGVGLNGVGVAVNGVGVNGVPLSDCVGVIGVCVFVLVTVGENVGVAVNGVAVIVGVGVAPVLQSLQFANVAQYPPCPA